MTRLDLSAPGLPGLMRRAAKLPPHRALAKAARYIRRQAAEHRERQADLVAGTHLPLVGRMPWRSRLALGAGNIGQEWHPALAYLGEPYRAHRFDILGSGEVDLHYDPPLAAKPDREGAWLTDRVNGSNLAASQELWSRIDDAHYRPIDWQRDVRSGYRWRGDVHFTKQPIPVDTGADVKVPWELGRLQHLPQLSLCAILAKEGVSGFAPADDYAREVTSQLLDFLALNPPRFGVHWMCAMDVGIRIVNILLAIDLLASAGLGPAPSIIDIALRAAREHAEYIAANLEWSASGRGNHYLANLVGILWAAAYLPPNDRTDALFAFAAGRLLVEADSQFGFDGGNYEGSTNYHRLSGELVLFGVALLAGLAPKDLARLDRAGRVEPLRGAPQRPGKLERYFGADGGETIVPPSLLARLYRAGALTRAATRPDGHVTQIGDTDSGRLIKLEPTGTLTAGASGRAFKEDPLNHFAFAAGIDALFGSGSATGSSICAPAVRALAKGRVFSRPATVGVCDHGDLDAAIAAIAALPQPCRRHRRIEFGDTARGPWQRAAFPAFGLYIFATDGAFIAFRCAPPPPATAPLGHTHDDNLGLEWVIGDSRRIDPGSFCYTPSLSLRDRYRSADAHDVVRAEGWELAVPGSDPFAIHHEAWATCTAWRAEGLAGEVVAPRGRLLRALRLSSSCLEIWDGVSPPNRLRPLPEPLPVAGGYGWLQTEGPPA